MRCAYWACSDMAEHFFTLPDGRAASLYRLRLDDGFGADISDFGGTLISLYAPDHTGKLRDVVLGWQEPETYLENPGYLGALVGRIPNRIGGGRFTLDGKIYQMFLNDNGHCTLHGGFGYSHRLWQVKKHTPQTLELALTSPDGDAGFPGTLQITAKYKVKAGHILEISFHAVSDALSVVDLTSHAYFNLEGEKCGGCASHTIQMKAFAHTEVDQFLVPTGKVLPVDGTLFDLRNGRNFQEILTANPAGFDDNFILGTTSGETVLCDAAVVTAADSGIRMRLHTDRPGVQFYMGGFLPGTEKCGKSGKPYPRHSGFCLETQCWPDAVNHPEFPSVYITPDRPFSALTRLEFDTI